MTPRFLSRKSVAEFFDTSPQTVDRWVRAGVIPEPIPEMKRWDVQDLIASAKKLLNDAAGVPSDDPDEVMRRRLDA
jgi:predicted site-specific integrase-resolvase